MSDPDCGYVTEVLDHLKAAVQALPPLTVGGQKGIQLRLNLGRTFLDLEDHENANRLAGQILGVSPDHRGAMLLKIDAAAQAGDTSTALGAIDAGRTMFLSEAEFLRKKIGVLRRGGQLVAAAALLQDLSRAEPGNASVFVELGNLHLSQSNLTKAQHAFLRALTIDKQNAGAWHGRIAVAQRRGDPITTCEITDQAFAVFPEDPEIIEKKSLAWIALGRVEEARTLLAATLEKIRSPKPSMILALALALRRMGDFDAADRLHEDLLAQDPGHVGAWSDRIQAALDQGDLDKAMVLSAEATKHCPDAPFLARLRADVLRRAGREEEAVEALENLRRQHPRDLAIIMALAGMYRQTGRLDEADCLYTEALAIEPHHWPALQGRVAIAESRGDLEAAMKLLEQGPLADAASSA